jgi:hypothetical protein
VTAESDSAVPEDQGARGPRGKVQDQAARESLGAHVSKTVRDGLGDFGRNEVADSRVTAAVTAVALS